MSIEAPHRSHPGNTVGYNNGGRVPTIFVTCPKNWLGDGNGSRAELVDWKKAGYPNGMLQCSEGWTWVVSPNPGCEL